MLTPFDLHVLSTPPAFILSQDQTLLFYSGHSKLGFSFFTAFLGLFRSFFFSFSEIIPLSLPGPAHLSCFGPPSALRSLASLPVRIFTASEYFQGCITVYLSRSYAAFSSAAKSILQLKFHFVNSFFQKIPKFFKIFTAALQLHVPPPSSSAEKGNLPL